MLISCMVVTSIYSFQIEEAQRDREAVADAAWSL